MTDVLQCINSRIYWRSVNTIRLLTHTGVSSSSPHISLCQCWVSVGEAPPSPSCWGSPNTGRFPEKHCRMNPERGFPWTRSVCVCVCVSCVCSGLTKQDFCLFTSPRLFLVPVRISLTFVWLRQLLPLIQAAATEKHSKLGCKHNESVCVTGTSTMCTNMFSFVVFSMKTLEIYAGGLAADVAAQLDGGIPLETNDSAAPWWLKEELQLGAQWIHPSSSLPVIIIGGIGWCRLMVSWPISSKLYHTEGEKKFRAGDINQI